MSWVAVHGRSPVKREKQRWACVGVWTLPLPNRSYHRRGSGIVETLRSGGQKESGRQELGQHYDLGAVRKGQWYTLDAPEVRLGSHGSLASFKTGCPHPVSVTKTPWKVLLLPPPHPSSFLSENPWP